MDAVGASIYHNSPSRTLSFGTDYTVRMTIAAAGNVGIGTASPNALLEINDNIPRFSLYDTATSKEVGDKQAIWWTELR